MASLVGGFIVWLISEGFGWILMAGMSGCTLNILTVWDTRGPQPGFDNALVRDRSHR